MAHVIGVTEHDVEWEYPDPADPKKTVVVPAGVWSVLDDGSVLPGLLEQPRLVYEVDGTATSMPGAEAESKGLTTHQDPS